MARGRRTADIHGRLRGRVRKRRRFRFRLQLGRHQRHAERARRGRGRGQPRRLGRIRRGRLDRSSGRLGHRLREEDRLPGQRQDRQHLGRDGAADAHRRIRRGLGLRRCDDPPDRGRRRLPGQHRPDPQLRGRLRRAQGSGVQLGRRADVRRPARARLEPAHVRPGRGQARPDVLGRGLRQRRPVQRQRDRVRQPDLHRRRGAVPARAPAGPRDRRSVRARRGAVQRCDRFAQAAERAHRRVLVRLHEGDPARSRTATPRSAPPGR